MSMQGLGLARSRAARRRRLGSGRRLRGAGLLACVALLALPGAAPARTLEHKLSAGSGTMDYAGFAVDIDGDTAVVGAPTANGNRGAVYVYSRAGGDWTKTATLTAADPRVREYLGFSVAIDGDTIVAGAPAGLAGGGDGSVEGRVYTFTRTGAPDRHETAVLTATDAATGSRGLGWSVAIDGDTIVAGAPGYYFSGDTDRQGAVYTFARTGAAARTETARLTLAAGTPVDLLGWSVAIDGDTIVAGAPTISPSGGGGSAAGAVYTFASTGAATRNETAALTVSGSTPVYLGIAVAIDGDVIVAGAPYEIGEIGGVVGPTGAVYTFASTGPAARSQTARLTASGAAPAAYLGMAVDIEGGTIVVGGFNVDFEVDEVRNAAYVFDRTGAPARTETEHLLTPEGTYSFFGIYGSPVATSGGTVIVGAPVVDQNEGAAYVSGPETTITAGPADGSFTTDTTPAFAFEADVNVASFACRVDDGPWAACTSPREIGPLGDGEHTFEVRATDQYGDVDPSPATRTFTVDATPPDTTITAGPAEGALINTASPSFAFDSDEAGTFECQVDTGAWASCTSPSVRGPLGEGEHTFRVRAIDRATNVDPTPAERTFTVDTTPPQTTITAGPAEGSFTSDDTPEFAFDSDEPGTFECSVDDAAYAACSSPATIGPLSHGSHTFRVRAIDRATNIDPTPDSRTFVVNQPPVAVADAYSVVGGATLTVPAPGVLGNDSDGDGDALSAQAVSQPASGTLTLNTDGSLTYASSEDVDGPVTFAYRAFDGYEYSPPATVTITVQAGCDGLAATIKGTPGNDAIEGTGGNDVIAGLGGNDTIESGSGVDRVCGGAGNDTIDAGSGNDYASGGTGNDRVVGGSGDDALYGGAGDDRLDGGGDRDRLFGEAGIDRLLGGGDPDVLNGGADAPDACDGEGGSDSTTGGCETLTSVP